MDGRSFGYGEIVSLEDASCRSRPVCREPGYSCSGDSLLHLSVIIIASWCHWRGDRWGRRGVRRGSRRLVTGILLVFNTGVYC